MLRFSDFEQCLKRPVVDWRPVPQKVLDERKSTSDTVLWQVYPALRERVPEWMRAHPECLLRWLREVARPFRFLDLLAELRNAIYDYLIPTNIAIELAPLKRTVTGYPTITAASRLLRSEALPLCYTRCTLRVILYSPLSDVIERRREEKSLEVAEGIKACIRHLSSDGIRFLRSLHLLLPRGSNSTRFAPSVRITFLASHGLLVQIMDLNSSPPLRDAFKKRLREHVEKTEKVRSLLRLQGEGILLALTTDESLWKRGFLGLE